MYSSLYRRFLNLHNGEQHYACHSHYYWPDVTYDAHMQYWRDSAQLVDDKWAYFAEVKIPDAQRLIAERIGINDPNQIVFAPNTHELLVRILSTFNKPIRILTSDSEFHSFRRQINRLAEDGLVEISTVPQFPLANFKERLISTYDNDQFDMVFLSQVFFNSGFVIPMDDILKKIDLDQCLTVIDGYHAFCAIPVDLSAWADKIFYLAGSYKYAQGGEGCCFMSVPTHKEWRPRNTGWFAEIEQISKGKSSVTEYPADAFAFAGSTIDYSALYRLTAVLQMFEEQNLNAQVVHSYIKNLQAVFLKKLRTHRSVFLNDEALCVKNLEDSGHFLSFRLNTENETKRIHSFLKIHHIKTDFRSTFLRFGFALYHQEDDIDLSVIEEIG